LVCAKSFYQFNAQRAQLVTHRGVDAGVAAGYAVACFAGQSGEATHEGAADAENVNVHAGILSRQPPCILRNQLSKVKQNGAMDSMKEEVAATAARLVVEEGLEYGAAKRRAVKQLGLSGRQAMPDNDQVEAAVREYIDLFCADTQPGELLALRALALSWMQRLAPFRPYLAGAVWHGTATRNSDIYLQLFCDDPKSAEIGLIDMGVRFETASVTGFQGETVDALSVHVRCPELAAYVGLHLMVYDFDDLRGALKPDAQGRRPRGDIASVRALLHDGGL
jgi:hypothetical protein